MKINRVTAILVFLLLLLMIGVVSLLMPGRESSPVRFNLDSYLHKNRVLVYFSKSRGNEIVTEPVIRKLSQQESMSGSAVLTYAITQLLEGPTEQEQSEGYFSEIPNQTRLLGITEGTKAIYIDFSKEYMSGGGSSSMLQRLQEVTRTVVSVSQPKPVYLKVEGKSLETLGGEGVMIHEPITEDPAIKR